MVAADPAAAPVSAGVRVGGAGAGLSVGPVRALRKRLEYPHVTRHVRATDEYHSLTAACQHCAEKWRLEDVDPMKLNPVRSAIRRHVENTRHRVAVKVLHLGSWIPADGG